MRLTSLIVLGFCVLYGCSKIDFILQNSSPFSILDGVTSYIISGDNIEYINEALIKNIGTTNKEEDVKFLLKVGINEENIKTSIDTNQVTTSIQYNINISYELITISGSCSNIVRDYKIKFTHYPKSAGYNFGTDNALREIYKRNINENVISFKSFIENKNIQKCLNEN
tara:strand:- start:1005 stop:1511 length:507 start_codon:yes stop_codon:yes gene_type:complete